MADPNYAQQFMNMVGQSDIGKQMLAYLTAAGQVPQVQEASMPYDLYGKFAGIDGPTGTITLNRSLSPARKPQTATHETVHSVDQALGIQADAYRRNLGYNQFEDTYNKLVRYGDAGAGPRKYKDPRYGLAAVIDPAWTEKYGNYRSSPDELAAWAVENIVRHSQLPESYNPPAHLNATMAQEFEILLDAAMRDLKRQKESKK